MHPLDRLVLFLRARLEEDERELARDPPAGLGYANLPARMRREISVKQDIVRRCVSRMNEMDAYQNGLVSPRALLARQVLIVQAACWEDHPDYRPGLEWGDR
jgi:hypothetical protein